MSSLARKPETHASASVPSVNLNLNVRGLPASATLAINELTAELLKAGKDIIKLGLGSRSSRFPMSSWGRSKTMPIRKTICP